MTIQYLISLSTKKTSITKSGFESVDFDANKKSITETIWSPIVFKDGVRSEDNFLSASLCCLDFDGGISLAELSSQLEIAGFFFVAAPSRNHQVSKNGSEPTDRFRLILKFENTIKDLRTYRYNMKLWIDHFGSDKSCRGGAQIFFPSKEIYAESDGDTLPVEIPPHEFENDTLLKFQLEDHSKRPTRKIPTHMWRFLNHGETFGGGRNVSCYVTALHLLAKGYRPSQVYTRLLLAPFDRTDFSDGEIKTAVRSAEKKMTRLFGTKKLPVRGEPGM